MIIKLNWFSYLNLLKDVIFIEIMDIINLFVVEIYGDGSFYLGEVIYGDVYLKVIDELILWEICVEFYGEVKVNWIEIVKFGRVRKRLGFLDYMNDEYYLNIVVIVYGKGLYICMFFFGEKIFKVFKKEDLRVLC